MGTLAALPPPVDVALSVDTSPVMLGIPLSADLSVGVQPARVDWASRTQSAVKRLQKLSNLPNPNALLMQPVPIWAHVLGAEVGRLNHGALLRTISGVVNVFCYRPSVAELANSLPPVRRMFQALAVMPCPQVSQHARLTPGTFREKQLQLLRPWTLVARVWPPRCWLAGRLAAQVQSASNRH